MGFKGLAMIGDLLGLKSAFTESAIYIKQKKKNYSNTLLIIQNH